MKTDKAKDENMSDNQVKKRFDKPAMVFLIIPLIFFSLSVLFFIVGCCLEQPTSRGTIYSLIMLGSFALLGLDLFPGGIFAAIGLFRAARAKMTGFFVLGLIEVTVAVILLFLVAYAVLVAGPGV
ncbi:MAG: hypothetical protein J5623_09305 [Clostridiales bacterium]|nr:hypothetical protein [Clostridiales bacterium]